jgi:hypothetical protein
MKVKVLPFNYIGNIVERGPVFHTVRLASGALVIAPTSLIETDGGVIYAQGDTAHEANGQPDSDRDFFSSRYV